MTCNEGSAAQRRGLSSCDWISGVIRTFFPIAVIRGNRHYADLSKIGLHKYVFWKSIITKQSIKIQMVKVYQLIKYTCDWPRSTKTIFKAEASSFSIGNVERIFVEFHPPFPTSSENSSRKKNAIYDVRFDGEGQTMQSWWRIQRSSYSHVEMKIGANTWASHFCLIWERIEYLNFFSVDIKCDVDERVNGDDSALWWIVMDAAGYVVIGIDNRHLCADRVWHSSGSCPEGYHGAVTSGFH